MKTSLSHAARRSTGFTLIEISLVIGLLLLLATFAGMNIAVVRDWQRGKDAGLALQAVFAAQRSYLSDHPTADIAEVSTVQLQVYLPQGWSTMPVVISLDNDALAIEHTIMPPRLMLGTVVYDPSGKGSDGLWDAGQ